MTTGISNMRSVSIAGLVLIACAGFLDDVWAQQAGEQAFQICAACHTIGGGRLIGPDLAGIHDKRSQEWLQAFIKSSQSMIKSGDAEAVAIFEEYNGMLMPRCHAQR